MKNLLLIPFTALLLQFIPPISPEVFSAQDDTVSITGILPGGSFEGFSPDPRKASMYAAVLPGMGQVYNRKYWKVPIVYGGFAGLGWYFIFTNDEFVRYRNALDFRIDGNPDTIDEFAGDSRYTEEVLTRFKDYYRKQRDRTVIWTGLFYALTIIDAAVDAHLFEFDVSEDLSLKVMPSVTGTGRNLARHQGGQMGIGVRFSINF